MPADYLSNLPSTNKHKLAEITQYFDPFQPELLDLQKADSDLQKMHHFWKNGKWPPNVSKSDANYPQNLAAKLYQDANKIVWIRLDNYKCPRTALFLLENFCKMALCEAQNYQFGVHNAALKTYIRLMSSYYWPRIYSDILKHMFLHCQQGKTSMEKPPLLHPLPTPDQPNIRIHADLLRQMLAARRQHKYIPCITNAFIKYTLIMAIENKEAETVAKAIFSEWFCKLSITAQVHTDGGKEFVNKLSRVLFDELNVENTKMNLAHPQCNAQVEVFNKTVKKVPSFICWRLPWIGKTFFQLWCSLTTQVATTPFKLLFRMKPRLPSFPNPDIQMVHYGEST